MILHCAKRSEKENENELNRIAQLTGLDQQFFARRDEDLLAEQDAIEYELGFTTPVRERTRCFLI
jgi:hypothetical protein